MGTNRRGAGLISMARGARPLAHLQYPALNLSRIQRICTSQYLELFYNDSLRLANFTHLSAVVYVMILDLGRTHGLFVFM